MSLVINNSSHTVYLVRNGEEIPIAPGEARNCSIPLMMDGELFLRADGEVECQHLVDGRQIVQMTFRDKRASLPEPEREDEWSYEDYRYEDYLDRCERDGRFME